MDDQTPKVASRTTQLINQINETVERLGMVLKPILSEVSEVEAQERASEKTELNSNLASIYDKLDSIVTRIEL